MERLTERDEYGNADIIALSDMMPELYAELSYSETNALTDTLNKLAAYEDAEDEGRLIKLPCKVGDTLFVLGNDLEEWTLLHPSITYSEEGVMRHCPLSIITSLMGKNVFLTREEAEKALKERESK